MNTAPCTHHADQHTKHADELGDGAIEHDGDQVRQAAGSGIHQDKQQVVREEGRQWVRQLVVHGQEHQRRKQNGGQVGNVLAQKVSLQSHRAIT